jgi:hypothetical protein
MWVRGDLHVHSACSQGAVLSPAEVVRAAGEAGLDFLAATEHNTAETHAEWGALGGDDLLVILGQEVVTRSGHWLALGLPAGEVVDWRYGVRDDGLLDRAVAQVRRGGGLCVAAHPHAPYPSGTLMYALATFDVVEVWNGPWRSDVPWQADNEAALAEWGRGLARGVLAGRWLPAIGNSDTHLPGQLGVPQSVVRADERSGQAVLAAVRAGRSWIAGSAGVDLSFTVTAGDRVAEVGDRLSGWGPVVVRAEVRGVPGGTVSLHTDRGAVHQRKTGEVVAWRTGPDESLFVRAEVRHADGAMAALTNPILLG